MSKFNQAARCNTGIGAAETASFAERQALSDVLEGFLVLARRTGFDFVLMATYPRGDRAGFRDNLLVSNWPQDLLEKYDRGDLFRLSRLVSNMKQTILPSFFSDGLFPANDNCSDTRRLSGEFASTGIRNTVAFPLFDAAGNQYVIAFSGQREPLSRQETMEILFGAMQVLDDEISPLSGEDGPEERLSARELECLRWSAAGKSSEEIAIILDISTHTVVSYIKGAMRKLDAVNRMQAIARAYRYRLL